MLSNSFSYRARMRTETSYRWLTSPGRISPRAPRAATWLPVLRLPSSGRLEQGPFLDHRLGLHVWPHAAVPIDCSSVTRRLQLQDFISQGDERGRQTKVIRGDRVTQRDARAWRKKLPLPAGRSTTN